MPPWTGTGQTGDTISCEKEVGGAMKGDENDSGAVDLLGAFHEI